MTKNVRKIRLRALNLLLNFIIMDKKVFEWYRNGLSAQKKAEEELELLTSAEKNLKTEKEIIASFKDCYLKIKESGKQMAEAALLLFQQSFPKNVKDFEDGGMHQFFSNIRMHPEMLKGCENKLFLLIKKAAEPGNANSFSWCWSPVYAVLTEKEIKDFVLNNYSEDFAAMVSSLSLHLDPIGGDDEERAVAFFTSLGQFEEKNPGIVQKSLDNLLKDVNFYRSSWVAKVVDFYHQN